MLCGFTVVASTVMAISAVSVNATRSGFFSRSTEPYVNEFTEYPAGSELGTIEIMRSPSGSVTLKIPSGPTLVGTETVPAALVRTTPCDMVIVAGEFAAGVAAPFAKEKTKRGTGT